MTIQINGANGLTFPDTSSQAVASKVLQVVTFSYSTQVSTTSSSWTSTGLSASITPKFSTSKIYLATHHGTYTSGGYTAYRTIFRNATNLGDATYGFNESANGWYTNSIVYLDSPGTTSAISYQVYFRTSNS